MFAKVFSASNIGLMTTVIEIETDLATGLPKFIIVGLGDTAVQESRERVMSALKHSGYEFPRGKVTVNLAPADIRKQGPFFDVPLAVSLLYAQGFCRAPIDDALFVWELALDGRLRRVTSLLPIALEAKKQGFKRLFAPKECAEEAACLSGLEVYGAETLSELIDHLEGRKNLQPITHISLEEHAKTTQRFPVDFKDIKGQKQAKRTLEIAASGGHNILLYGPPGSGKTMLSQAFLSILPPMTESEMIEVSSLHSVAGALRGQQFVLERPFRHPHHSASVASIVGGGSIPKPGEISLSHRGVLFLDEFPEFEKTVLESLRQPMEDKVITISRAQGSCEFPATFTLIAAMNPCPCGYLGDPHKACICSPGQIERYRNKISGPILDRLDIILQVPRISATELQSTEENESSETIRERVITARNKQIARFREHGENKISNSEMSAQDIEAFCGLNETGKQLLAKAVEKMHLSGRTYHRVLRVARTIADLAGQDLISAEHIAEALQYRTTPWSR